MEFKTSFGKLTITDTMVSLTAPNAIGGNWDIARSTIQGISVKKGLWVSDVTFNTAQGSYTARNIKSKLVSTIKEMTLGGKA